MSKSASHTKPANKHEAPRSNAAMERRSSLGAHVCVQRDASELGVQPHAPSLVREVLNSPGHPLDKETRSSMEPRFGHDFSSVRVHTDEKAAESARAVSANAYTAGSHLVFANGKYAPRSSAGKRLMAHELTHVTQQAVGQVEGTSAGGGLSVSNPSDKFERQAGKVGEQKIAPQDGSAPARRLAQRLQTPDEIHVQRQDAPDTPSGRTAASAGVASAAFGGLSALIGGVGLIAAFQSAAAGERQADAAEYQASGGFAFDSYSFGPFYNKGQRIPVPGVDTQGGPDEGADELPPIPLMQVVAGDANEAVLELTLRSNGTDILGGIIEQSDSRGYGGGPRGASGNLVFTATNQLANAGEVAVVAIHFRGTNHPAGKPVQRFHGRIVLGANGVIYRVECSHTSGMQGVVADCNSQRQPPIIVGSGRSALHDNPASGDLPSVRRARAIQQQQRKGAGDTGPEAPNTPPPNRGTA
jgi:hypothetical protein